MAAEGNWFAACSWASSSAVSTCRSITRSRRTRSRRLVQNLPHGQPVTPPDVERISSSWSDRGPAYFTALISSLIMARLPGPPVRACFGGPIWAPDGGIDANIELPQADRNDPFELVGPGCTVYQYKWLEASDGERSRLAERLQRRLLGDFKKIVTSENSPDRFVAITNLNLSASQAKKLETALAHVAPPGARTHIHLIGAAKLAAILNDVPHLRSAFFATLSFSSVQVDRDEMVRREAARGRRWIEHAVAREEAANQLREALLDPTVRVIQVCGPAGVGKSRLALDVLFEETFRGLSVVAASIDRLEAADLRQLQTPGRKATILLVDIPLERNHARRLVESVLGMDGLCLVLTLPSALEPGGPSIASIEVERLDDPSASKLLGVAAGALGFSLESWIVKESAGIPGLLLDAAFVAKELPKDNGDFRRGVGELLKARVSDRLGSEPLDAARAFSLLSTVRLAPEAHDVEALSSALELSPQRVRDSVGLLVADGILAARPPQDPVLVEVVPPSLAAALAREAIGNRPDLLEELFIANEGRLRGRLLRQLCELADVTIVQRFVEGLLGGNTPYRTLNELAEGLAGLGELSEAFPGVMAGALRQRITEAPADSNRWLDDRVRSSLLWLIDPLLMHANTFSDAVRMVFVLAQAEQAGTQQGAGVVRRHQGYFTDLLRESFHLQHPQIPASYEDRLSLLRDLWKGCGDEGRSLLVAAVQEMFEIGMVRLRRSSGPAPPEQPFQPTWEDMIHHVTGVLDLLGDSVGEASPILQPAICSAVGRLAVKGLEHGVKEPALKALEKVVAGAGVLSATERASLIKSLRRLDVHPPKWLGESMAPELTAWGLRLKSEIQSLCARLTGKSLSARLRISFGPSTSLREETQDSPEQLGERLRSWGEELAARVLHEDISDLDIQWLVSAEAIGAYAFFLALGRADLSHTLLSRICRVSNRERGPMALTCYLHAWQASERLAFLEKGASGPDVHARAVLAASQVDRVDTRSLRRIACLVENGHLSAEEVLENLTFTEWIAPLVPDELADFLLHLGVLKTAAASIAAVRLLYWRIHGRSAAATPFQASERFVTVARTLLVSALPKAYDHGFEWWGITRSLFGSRPDDLLALLREVTEADQGFSTWAPDVAKGVSAIPDSERNRFISLLFDHSTSKDELRFSYRRMLGRVVLPERDQRLLMEMGAASNAHAHVVAELLSGSSDAVFWAVTGVLLDRFPDDRDLGGRLRDALHFSGFEVRTAHVRQLYETRAEAAEAYANGPTAKPASRSFARSMAESLRKRAVDGLIWEYALDSRDLSELARAGTPAERRWVIERVLGQASSVGDALRTLISLDVSPEEIRRVLPDVQLRDRMRRAFEMALEVMPAHG